MPALNSRIKISIDAYKFDSNQHFMPQSRTVLSLSINSRWIYASNIQICWGPFEVQLSWDLRLDWRHMYVWVPFLIIIGLLDNALIRRVLLGLRAHSSASVTVKVAAIRLFSAWHKVLRVLHNCCNETNMLNSCVYLTLKMLHKLFNICCCTRVECQSNSSSNNGATTTTTNTITSK